MTSSSSLYGSVTTQNSSSSNSTSLYGEAGTPIPDSSGNVVVRGDLYVLSGNILTTATTGNIFPANATTINLGNAATTVNIGAGTGTTTINNNLVVDGTITGDSGDFGNITIGVADDQTITTTTGRLVLKSASGEIDTDTTSIISTNSSSFFLLNSPTTVNAFQGATTLTMGATTGTTTIRNNLVADSGDFGNITIGVVDGNTIATTSGDLNLLPTGNNGVNITSGSDAPTLITRNSAVTNTSIRGLALSAQTSLTPAAGFGASLEYQVEAQTGNVERAGYISVNATDVTAGSEDFSMYFGLMENGAAYTSKMILDSTGSLALDNDLTIGGTTVNLAQATTFAYSENNDRLNRPEVQSTTGNSSGFRVKAPNTGTSAAATLSVGNSSDSANTEFLALQARGSALGDTFRIFTGEYIGGVLNATNKSISFTDNTNEYATVNPAGPTVNTDLTTKLYVDNAVATTGVTSITGTADQVIASSPTGAVTLSLPQSIATTSNVTFADVIVGDDLTVNGNNINLAQNTIFGYSENNDRLNRPSVQSTTGNSSGLRVIAPNTGTNTQSTLSVNNSSDTLNNEFLAIQARGSSLTNTFRFLTGEYTAGVIGATGKSVAFVDNTNTYATINPAGPTATTDLTTKSYVDGLIPVVPTYDTNVVSVSGGVELDLQEIVGASISIVGSTKFLGGTNVTISETSPNEITISAPDLNTTYDFNATSTTGGANLNLVGSDSTTDTVKLTNGGHITATYTSGTEVTLGSDATDANTVSTIVARDASGNFAASGATLGAVTVGVDTDNTISTSSGNLTLQTAAGVNAGTMVLTAGANGAITLAPNGTGNVVNTFSNGGNLTNNRNYVFGAIRNATTAAAGDVWNFNTTGLVGPTRGISLDNSADTTKNPGEIIRAYSGSAASGQRPRLVFEKARNTAASPSANAAADVLGGIEATGYSSTGWVNDTISAAPGNFVFVANEAWVSNTNLGTGYVLNLAPTATTISTAANLVQALNINPQTNQSRSDNFTWGSGKSATTFTATGSSISSTTLTIGTVTAGTVAVGQFIQTATLGISSGTYIVSNISGSGSGSTWVVSQGQTVTSTTITGTSGGMYLSNSGNLDVIGSALVRGSSILGTNAGTNYASISSTGQTFTTTGLGNFIRQSTTNTTLPAVLLRHQRTDTTGSNDGDGVDFRLSTGGTSTSNNIARFDAQYRTSGFHQFGISVSTDNFAADTDTVYRAQADKTVIRATPTGTTGTASDIVTVESTKITMAAPVAFPVYTAAAANAITGAVGWQISISNSASGGNPNGMMAFWDTTNARWSYIHDNSAV